MKKILIFLINSAVTVSVYSADDLFNKPPSLLILKNDSPEYEIKSREHVDFFESVKQQEQDRLNQRDVNAAKMYETRSNTSNMSPFERSQYLLKNNDTRALNAYEYEQQLNSLQKARNRGVISDRDYQQKITQQNHMPLKQKNNQLKLTVPVGE
ncbi:hypothetical protein [Acinetobacter higginsii]|uniref:hypothetical protein n=1 Tax=Acinetobacter higginsii TaxID=70347 RepID=UPI001F4B0C5A|nr:hypothetical protein [Acinetobacter higginsii]MCH7293885.1 hypothetical protein [Acinetobacter higginsii]